VSNHVTDEWEVGLSVRMPRWLYVRVKPWVIRCGFEVQYARKVLP
jgi:hypothetical protein